MIARIPGADSMRSFDRRALAVLSVLTVAVFGGLYLMAGAWPIVVLCAAGALVGGYAGKWMHEQ